MKTVLVVNPRSADGTTGRDWPRLRDQILAHLPGAGEVFTQGRGDAARAAREALLGGADLVVGIGGDGTNNEVLNGFFEADGRPVKAGAEFAFLPRGTGCDFARFLGMSRDLGEAARTVAAAQPWPIDVGWLSCVGAGGEPVTRVFLNIMDFGIGGMISARVNRSSKRFGGFISFLWHTLASLLVYRDEGMELVLDDGTRRAGLFRAVVVANGRYFGGGMNIAPRAALDDGCFEHLVIPEIGFLEALRWTPSLYMRAGILAHPRIGYQRIKSITATPLVPGREIWIEMDGENPGKLPVTVKVLPGAVLLRAPHPPSP